MKLNTIIKKLAYILPAIATVGLLATSCDKNELYVDGKTQITGAFSIMVDNGNVLLSGFSNNNNRITTKYWIDTAKTDSATFVGRLKNGSLYNGAVDDQFRKIVGYKTTAGENEVYKFDQGSLAEGGRIFYFKNNTTVRPDTTALGTITTVYFKNDKPYFAGYFGEIFYSEAGKSLHPKTPFVWDGVSKFISLPVQQGSFFRGVTSIYVSPNGDTYVGALTDYPLYWKNSEPVKLDTRFGEVYQIVVSGTDVYAVGLINKYNSNSTAHTACYWKNGVLTELDNDAQAYGIYLSGNDIYVAGSTGRVPAQYRACYWKNCVRVDLPY